MRSHVILHECLAFFKVCVCVCVASYCRSIKYIRSLSTSFFEFGLCSLFAHEEQKMAGS